MTQSISDRPVAPLTATASSSQRRGMSCRSRLVWLVVICLVVIGVDQATKIYAVNYLKGQPPQIFFGDLFRIEYAENHGAFLSLLANSPPEVRFWTLTVVNGLVLAGLTLSLVGLKSMSFSSFLPLALIVAGGIGNLIDRVQFRYVIDFLNLGIGSLRTGIFNVADMAISLGFVLILPLLLKKDPDEPAAKSPVPDDSVSTKTAEVTTVIRDK
ncbi:signal peptidase II [Planctomicrobium sp. SH527]|uniref:signal peptidase II n=1 Tax=Planctomicrobium sp. SH527 TaxID=3448123 RepID=UPI003F5BAEE0